MAALGQQQTLDGDAPGVRFVAETGHQPPERKFSGR